MRFLCKNSRMKIWIGGPASVLKEWNAVPVTDSLKIIQTIDNILPDESEAVDAIVYLFPEQDEAMLTELRQHYAPIRIVNAVIPTCTELGEGLVRINGWPGFLGRPLAEMAAPASVDIAPVNDLMKALGRQAEWVADTEGMLSVRVIASIINEAWFALEEGISTPEEIDTAMKMGTNYPLGPFEWGRKIGLNKLVHLLDRLAMKQERYSPCPLLKKEALA
jgi:3-hydroxybutyryl-CoA dehydrogenase